MAAGIDDDASPAIEVAFFFLYKVFFMVVGRHVGFEIVDRADGE